MEEDSRLRILYSQIIKGVSPVKLGGNILYGKHITPSEQGEFDNDFAGFVDLAVTKGLIKEEIKLQELDKKELWTSEQEKDLENSRRVIEGMMETKRKLPLLSQIKEMAASIEKEEKSLQFKIATRHELLGPTAEKFARRKLDAIYIYKTLYKDAALSELAYSWDDFNNWDQEELNNLILATNETDGSLGERGIQLIALSGFFQNVYRLCDDNIYHFYGKPIVELTARQIKLVDWGSYFRRVLSEKPPQEVMEDPDKLIDWHSSSQNSGDMMKNQNASNVAIMGATTEDLKAAAASSGAEVVTLGEVMKGKSKVRGRALMNLLKGQG